MTSDEDKVRFHNGDTLENIPVIGPVEPKRREIPWRTVAGTVGTALLVGTIIGTSIGMGSRSRPQAQEPAPDTSPSLVTASQPATPTPTPNPTPTVTETVTAEPPAEAPIPHVDPYIEQVRITSTPETGGDPSTDYCLMYSEGEVVLLNYASSLLCHDFLFSTNPGVDSVFVEDGPPTQCEKTPGGRTALLVFDPYTSWGGPPMYTCLLLNDSL